MIETIREITREGRAIEQAALEAVIEVERPWDESTKARISSFLTAFSYEMPKLDVDYALAYYDNLSNEGIVFVLTDEDPEYPELGHVVPVYPLDIRPGLDLRTQLQLVLTKTTPIISNRARPGRHVHAISGSCWCSDVNNKRLSWCVYLWSAITSEVVTAMAKYWETWSERKDTALEPVLVGQYISDGRGILTVNPDFVRNFPTINSANLPNRDEYTRVMQFYARWFICRDIQDYLNGLAIPGLNPDVSLNISIGPFDFSLLGEYEYHIRKDAQVVLNQEETGEQFFGNQYYSIFDRAAIAYLNSVGITGPVSMYNRYKEIENIEELKERTPGVVYAYFNLLISDKDFVPGSVTRPDEIATVMKNYLGISRGAWKVLAKTSKDDLHQIYESFKLDPRSHAEILEIISEVGVNLDPYGHLGIARGLYTRTVKDNPEYFRPILKAYARQAALPDEERRHGLTSRELAQDIQDVMDWAVSKFNADAQISQTSQWGGYARASEEWHRRMYEEEIDERANRLLVEETRKYGDIRTWQSKIGECVIDGYTVTPMLSRADLLAIGNENSVCVGSVDYYTEECVSGTFRIFSIRKGSRMSILTISLGASGWSVNQHSGRKNSQVDDAHQKVAEVIIDMYEQ